MARPGGVIDRMLRDIRDDLGDATRASMTAALAGADVIFTHDPFAAEYAVAQRHAGQQVWMMCHGISPMVLYVAWSWALPEADWRELGELADVRSWTEWEIDVWSRVDRLIIPCAEAGDSFRTIDRRFDAVLDRAHHLLSGASAPASRGGQLSIRSSADQRIGLYLGSPEPYRGFDALLAAVRMLPRDANLVIAVAGPHPSKVPAHPLLRPLGRVEDVAALLASVDFLVNVNRFTLFDLSTIEAAEAARPLLLHRVGGNRAFERLGAGCMMLSDLQPRTIADALAQMASLEQSQLQQLGRQSRACWEAHLTPSRMWERHLALYDSIA